MKTINLRSLRDKPGPYWVELINGKRVVDKLGPFTGHHVWQNWNHLVGELSLRRLGRMGLDRVDLLQCHFAVRAE